MILQLSAVLTVLATIGMPHGTVAFVTKSTRTFTVKTKPSTRSTLYMGPPVDPSAPITELYGEGSRKYRRTVYNHDLWVKHRSPDRFVNNLKTLFNSGIYKQIGNEVALTVCVAMVVCGWNLLVGGYQDFAGVQHDAIITEKWAMMVGLPLTPFTILTPSLGLLLGEISTFSLIGKCNNVGIYSYFALLNIVNSLPYQLIIWSVG